MRRSRSSRGSGAAPPSEARSDQPGRCDRVSWPLGRLPSAAVLSTVSALVWSCAGGDSARPTDGGFVGDGDLASCVLYGPVGMQRAGCPIDLPSEDDCAMASP